MLQWKSLLSTLVDRQLFFSPSFSENEIHSILPPFKIILKLECPPVLTIGLGVALWKLTPCSCLFLIMNCVVSCPEQFHLLNFHDVLPVQFLQSFLSSRSGHHGRCSSYWQFETCWMTSSIDSLKSCNFLPIQRTLLLLPMWCLNISIQEMHASANESHHVGLVICHSHLLNWIWWVFSPDMMQ